MESRLYRATLFALYQLTVLVGLVTLPIALLVRQMGITVPVHRVIDRVEAAYDRTTEQA